MVHVGKADADGESRTQATWIWVTMGGSVAMDVGGTGAGAGLGFGWRHWMFFECVHMPLAFNLSHKGKLSGYGMRFWP
jgi:hypothetical protein